MSFTNIVTQAGNIQGKVGTVTNFAKSILSLFGGDIVGVFDNETFAQLFPTARPTKGSFHRAVKVMDHPIESGSLISDFAVNLPAEIELEFVVGGDDYPQVVQLINQYVKSHTLVVVHLKIGSISNMIIESLAHDETPDVFDSAPITLHFRQVQIIKVQYQALAATQVAAPKDQSTVNVGTQQPQESALYQIGSFFGGLFK